MGENRQSFAHQVPVTQVTLVFRESAEKQERTSLQIENSLISRVSSDPPAKTRRKFPRTFFHGLAHLMLELRCLKKLDRRVNTPAALLAAGSEAGLPMWSLSRRAGRGHSVSARVDKDEERHQCLF